MRKLFTLLFFVSFTLAVNCQGLFRPVPSDLFTSNQYGLKSLKNASVWIPRISAGVIATQWTLSDGRIQQQAFNKTGIGISYAHYIENEGLPYNNVSLNGFIFFPVDGTSSKVALAVTASILQYLQFGIDYDFGIKKLGLLTGLSYTF